MPVGKRRWKVKRTGEIKESWVVELFPRRRTALQDVDLKRDADAYFDKVRSEKLHGTHTPENKSITVSEAAADWLAYVELEGLERSTIEYYRSHVDLHIN